MDAVASIPFSTKKELFKLEKLDRRVSLKLITNSGESKSHTEYQGQLQLEGALNVISHSEMEEENYKGVQTTLFLMTDTLLVCEPIGQDLILLETINLLTYPRVQVRSLLINGLFEVSTQEKSIILRAESDNDRGRWVTAISLLSEPQHQTSKQLYVPSKVQSKRVEEHAARIILFFLKAAKERKISNNVVRKTPKTRARANNVKSVTRDLLAIMLSREGLSTSSDAASSFSEPDIDSEYQTEENVPVISSYEYDSLIGENATIDDDVTFTEADIQMVVKMDYIQRANSEKTLDNPIPSSTESEVSLPKTEQRSVAVEQVVVQEPTPVSSIKIQPKQEEQQIKTQEKPIEESKEEMLMRKERERLRALSARKKQWKSTVLSQQEQTKLDQLRKEELAKQAKK
ncbi:hypothetical protein AKO1_000738 [Acrasis kona]|uniref:PH domain-containing protein n=1 Tax=Acrasis kona TaxID=1008807 RepID=A0AAW2ZK01_9EUKA